MLSKDISKLVTLTLLLFLLFTVQDTFANSVTSKTYKKLTEVQEQMAEENITEAISTLEELKDEVKPDSLDLALTLQMLGYAAMANENFGEAIVHLKQSLSLNKLPEKVKYNVGYMVAQLHSAQGEFVQAIDFAAEWFDTLEQPTPAQMMFMANIYAQTKNYKQSIPFARRAISESATPKESWFQLLIAAHYELEDFKSAASALQKIIGYWPGNSSYWEQLASVYVMLEDESRALATLRLAWMSGVLEREESIKSMVQLAFARGIPEHAAKLLILGFDKELLPREPVYVRMLANAWLSAREAGTAIDTFKELAELEEKGEPLLRAANLYIEQGDWNMAEKSLESAINKGLEEPGKAWLLLGIAHAEQENFKQCFASLRKARSFEDTKRQATKWITYAQDMRKQHEWKLSYGS